MKKYFYSILAFSISAALQGAACSSEQLPQGRICFSDLQRPMHVYESIIDQFGRPEHNFRESNENDYSSIPWIGKGFFTSKDIIVESSLQNPRLKKGFPTLFTLRYRNQDGTWNCSDRHVMPRAFYYRDFNLQEHIGFLREHAKQIHEAPIKRFPTIKKEDLYSLLLPEVQENSIPQDISMYLELNRFNGPLLYTVGDYFRCFPKLAYLSLKRYMTMSYDFLDKVICPAVVFSRVQEGRNPHESLGQTYYDYRQQLSEQHAEFTDGIAWDTLPELPIGDIPVWPAQCMRTKESLTFLKCLEPSIHTPKGRVIDLRNHTINPNEIQSVGGEGNTFILSTKDVIYRDYGYFYTYTAGDPPSLRSQITQTQVEQINEHFIKQCSLKRRFLDTMYRWRYYMAAGAAAAVVGMYIYQHHTALVAERAKEIEQVTERLDVQEKAYRFLKEIIDSAKDKQNVPQLSVDEMHAVLNAQIDIKAVVKERNRLEALMPISWKQVDSLFAAIRNKIWTITGIGLGTYVAEVWAKYFLGYRPYMPSRIEVVNHFHDYYADKIPYSEVYIEPRDCGRDKLRGYCCTGPSGPCDIETFYQHKPRKFDDILPHYDEATETVFKRNQNIALVAAYAAAVYGLHKILPK